MAIIRHNRSQTKLQQRRNARPQRARVVRSSVQPTRIKPKREFNKKNTVRSLIIGVFFVVLLAWSAYTGPIVVSNTDPKSEKEAKAAASEYLSGFRNLWWFVSVNDLESSIIDNSPHIANVNISRGMLSRRIVIDVETRNATFLLRTSNLSYQIAQDGVIMQKTSSSDVSLPIIYDEAAVDSLKVGQPYLPARDMLMMRQIIEQIDLMKPKSFKYFVLVNNTREIQAHLKQGYYIKFSSTDDLTDQINDLKLAQTKLKSDPKVYIDVRFSGRVFVK